MARRIYGPRVGGLVDPSGNIPVPGSSGLQPQSIQQAVEKRPIESFDFVGITEQFDESLVLIYDLFGWEPVYYRRKNVGGYELPDLSNPVIEKFRELNAADFEYYEKAVAKLERRKQLLRPDFAAALSNFRNELVSVQESESDAQGSAG